MIQTIECCHPYFTLFTRSAVNTVLTAPVVGPVAFCRNATGQRKGLLLKCHSSIGAYIPFFPEYITGIEQHRIDMVGDNTRTFGNSGTFVPGGSVISCPVY